MLGADHPNTLVALEYLAADLNYEGRYNDATKVYREAIQTAGKGNNPGVLADAWYNFACGTAVAGHRDEALNYLQQAVDHGFEDFEVMASDSDLKSLHDDPRFHSLLIKGHETKATLRAK